MRGRWWVWGAVLLFAGVGSALWPSAPPAPAAAATAPAPARPEPAPPAPPSRAQPAARVGPLGKRVPLEAPLEAHFDVPVDAASIELALDPPAAGRLEWTDARTLRFVPERWRAGRAYRVSLSGLGREGDPLAPVQWQFRTRIPKPAAIVPGDGRPLVLTFDDGPHKKRQADRLLDVLREHGARAVFFPTGRWTRQRADWVERARREGHRICNHSYSHKNLTQPWVTEQDIRFEIENGAGHGDCTWFRPPLMAFDGRVERVARELGYSLYFWDVDSRDWEDTPALDVYNLVLARARPEAVVLLHMHAAGTLRALPRLLERLRRAGYVLTHEGTRPPPKPVVGGGGSESHPVDEVSEIPPSPTGL